MKEVDLISEKKTMASADLAAIYVELDALKTLVDVRFEAHKSEHGLMKDALAIAKEGLEHRLHVLNESRAQIEKAESKMLLKEEWIAGHTSIVAKQEAVEKWAESRFQENGERVDEKITSLGERVDNYETATEGRLRVIDRTIWIAAGAASVIGFLLRWIIKS